MFVVFSHFIEIGNGTTKTQISKASHKFWWKNKWKQP